MKNIVGVLIIVFLSFSVLFVSCDKNSDLKSDYETYKDYEADVYLKGDGKYEKTITSPLIKSDDCKYIVAGTITFHIGDKVAAIIDFGDGTCDNIATKTIGDKIIKFNLDKIGKGDKGSKVKKVVIEPLVKIDNCDFIVSGIIKLYKGDKWIVTIDYGDGQCDDIATKYWDGGSEEFSLTKNK